MGYRLREYVCKGICNYCEGSGFFPGNRKRKPDPKSIFFYKAQPFDIDKCSFCGGSGKLFELN